MEEKVECLICKKKFIWISNTHLKLHGLTCEEYKNKFPGSSLKSEQYKFAQGSSLRGKTYEEKYGKEKADELKKVRTDKAIKQFEDEEQRKIRTEICAQRRDYDNWYKSMKKFFNDPIRLKEKHRKSKETIKRRYVEQDELTVKEKFILGGRTSKSAINFINNFIKKNNINEINCYFATGGRNNKEFVQYIKEHQIFASYDFVSYKDDILDIVIEYNGPWHYTYEDVIERGNEISASFFSKKTIKEIYEKDIIKLNHIKTKTENVFVYWEKYKKFVKYINEDSYKIENIINNEETLIIN